MTHVHELIVYRYYMLTCLSKTYDRIFYKYIVSGAAVAAAAAVGRRRRRPWIIPLRCVSCNIILGHLLGF